MTDPKPCKTAVNHVPTVRKTMGVTVAKLPDTTMTDNSADNDSTKTTDKHATLTEYLSAADNTDDSIDGAAKITHVRNGAGVWQTDGGEGLEDDPDEYRVECSCGESFGSWYRYKATDHVEEEH